MAGAIIDVVSEDWGTPIDFFGQLERMFGKFDLDAAAADNWSMCDEYITKEMDALNPQTPWNGKNVFLNPPYGHWIPKFLKRVLEEAKLGKKIVCLLPAKTDTRWFHEIVVNNADEILFVQGRLKFRLPQKNNTATFGSIVVGFNTQPNSGKSLPLFGCMRNKEKCNQKRDLGVITK